MTKTDRDLAYYLNLPYPVLLIPDPDDNIWYARIPMLDGCMSDGETPEEALKNLREAQELWLEVAIEDGDDIPVPEPPQVYIHSRLEPARSANR